jgi:7-carboxy-7-deazaguanine synthase
MPDLAQRSPKHDYLKPIHAQNMLASSQSAGDNPRLQSAHPKGILFIDVFLTKKFQGQLPRTCITIATHPVAQAAPQFRPPIMNPLLASPTNLTEFAPTHSTGTAPISKTAPLQEIFSSIQGEGIHVGKRQVFVRFAHCHLKCAYCDTPMTSPTGQCHVEAVPGSGDMLYYPNPMRPETLAEIVNDLVQTAAHHSISFTGGEPLLYHSFLKDALPLMHSHAPIYLETSGTQTEFFADILDWVDIVAMDIKLPSATGEAPQFDNHTDFYQLARQKECFIKIVFNENTTQAELAAVERIVTDPTTPIILQPETSLVDRKVYLNPRRLFEIETYLSARFNDIRVIPQTHKMLNVL